MNQYVRITQTIILAFVCCGFSGGVFRNLEGRQANNNVPFAMTPVYAADSPDAIPNRLQGTKWYLSGGSAITPLADVPVMIQFSETDFSGNASCNNFRGTYAGTDNNLAINRMISTTRKACPEAIMAQEKQLVRILPKVQSYTIDRQGSLTLTYNHKGKSETLVFIPESQLTPLHNTQWQLVTMAGEAPIAGNKPPTLNFSGKSLSGSGGCNRLIGQFTVDGNTINIGEQMASTMMACPEPLMEQEQRFIKALTTAREYAIMAPGNLVITYGDDPGQELRFTPVANAPDPASKGVEKVIYVAPSQANCTGVGPQKCLQVKESLDQDWKLHYFAIQGFDYEPGYTYRLRIREDRVANPPADGSSVTWTLMAIESKTPR